MASFACGWFVESIAQVLAEQKEIHNPPKHLKPAINCITLPAEDLKKSLGFHRDGLGLPAQFSAELEDGADRTAFELASDLWLVLMPRAEFAKCTKIAHQPDAPRGSSECLLSYFAASKEGVDAILKRANATGGAVQGEAEDQPWGHSGYFTDPDGHLWEIIWKPTLVGDATQANQPLFRTCKRSVTWRNWAMPPKNNYYNEVILSDPTLTVDNPVSGHEIQVIVGSPSKVAKGPLIEFAKELTEHIRGNQRWSGIHVTVEPIELQDLPPLGEPRHIEGDLTAWILE